MYPYGSLLDREKNPAFFWRFYMLLFFGDFASLRWGWVFLERTRILSGIQFTKQFIEFVVVETEQFVSSNINVILTRQTCGQHTHTHT